METNCRNLLSVAVVLAVLSLGPARADAYAFTKTSRGESAHWQVPTVTFTLDRSLAGLGDLGGVVGTIRQAAETWSNSADLPFDLVVAEGECSRGVGAAGGNVNCVVLGTAAMFGDDSVGATTFVSFTDETGVIVDADIVLNPDADVEDKGGGIDPARLAVIVLHEIGHAIGLAHSEVEGARMFPRADLSNESGRDLRPDDVAGARALYEGVDLQGAVDPASCDGRSSMAPGSPATPAFFVILLVLAWVSRR